MSQRAARRRQARVDTTRGTNRAKRDQGPKFNPRLITIITAGVALALVLAVWLVNRSGDPGPAQGTAGSVLAGALSMGPADAAVTVVEFGDYKCPACRNFDVSVYPQLYEDYIAPGRIRFQYVHFPFLAPDSITAALATKAVQKQDPAAAWLYHHALFAAQGSQSVEWATRPFLLDLATSVAPDLDHDQLAADLGDKAISAAVRSELDYTRRLGINVTPSVMVNGSLVASPTYEDVRQAIDDALAAAASEADTDSDSDPDTDTDSDTDAGRDSGDAAAD